MKSTAYTGRDSSRVPVSATESTRPAPPSQTGPIGLNKHHEARLITSLVEYYGWTLCADGNLYNPFAGEEAHVA